MKRLTSRYAVYVPSDFNGSGYSRDSAIDEVTSYLTGLIGGCTSIQGQGSWLNDSDIVVTEEVTIIYGFAERNYDITIRQYAIEACKRWHQDCLAVEDNQGLLLIDATDVAF